ncbi:MAG TPA: FAD-dependent oxidoreductase [Actinophytocola sp.]|nr:FAD-dependent oxidoreductase [Actinophytocola sp.]HEU5473781.1 FAD-dependent oxidoreductase [Actinophytocola sp.]
MRQAATDRLHAAADSPERTLAAVRSTFRGAANVKLLSTRVGLRPMPADGEPIIGPVADVPGLYLAVMHSAVTLARPAVGHLVALPRKNCWTIAEHVGDRDAHGMQHLLARARWDTDGVRDDLRDYVIGALGDTDGILVVDETGDSRRATTPSECNATTPAPPGGSRTRKSRSIWLTPDAVGTH